MSVDKLHRTESKFGVYDRARRIRKMVNDFLDRDFGIKVCKRDIRNAAVGKYRRLEDGSTEFYVRMPKQAEKHSRIEDYYIFMPVNGSTSENGELMVREIPEWKLEKYRDELWENAKHIAEDVRRANSIYAYYPTEYYERRKLQDMAVAHCFNLHDSLLEVAEDLPVTLEKVMHYTYGLVRTAMSEEAARKNYIIEYVKSILIAEHAYAMDFRDRNKRISQILQYAYRKKGSSKGSLFDETEIGNILGSYGIGFSQMLTRKIQDCCNKGALEGRASFPFYKEDSPFTVTKAAMGFSHEYDSYEELCEHVKDCKLYFDYGGNGKPHIARFQIDLGHGRNRDKLMATLLKVYSGEYAYCGSSIQISKNKIVLNLSLQIPKEEKDELDKDTVVGVALGLVQPAVCALNNDQYVRLPIGDERDLLDNKLQIQERRRRLQSALRETSGGHGRKKKMQALNRIAKTENNFTETYCHMVSKRIVEFALQNNAKYINMENLSGYNTDKFILRNSYASKIIMYTTYKAGHYGIEVRLVNPCFNAQVCSICGNWTSEQKISRTEFVCADPDCKSHTNYKKGFTADFNHARNVAMSTLFMENGSFSKKSMDEAAEYYGISEKYKA